MWPILLTLALTMAEPASQIRASDDVVFYPTYARQSDDGSHWHVRVHGLIFEPERSSLKRTALFSLLRRMLGLLPEQAETVTFRERARPFLVGNLSGRTIHIRLGEQVYEAGTSTANGHFSATLELPSDEVKKLQVVGPGGLPELHYTGVVQPNDARSFTGRVQLIGKQGLSIISDIDDTIKISNVGNRRKLLGNTFLRSFKPVDGMSQQFDQWAQRGACFHYVSATPWQLFGPLESFRETEKFPPGPWELKAIRLKDRSALTLFTSQANYKPAVLRKILTDFPERQFVLIGDSGEQDPEIFGEMAREHPKQIVRVLVRHAAEQPANARFERAFEKLPAERWQVFKDAAELKDALPTELFKSLLE